MAFSHVHGSMGPTLLGVASGGSFCLLVSQDVVILVQLQYNLIQLCHGPKLSAQASCDHEPRLTNLMLLWQC